MQVSIAAHRSSDKEDKKNYICQTSLISHLLFNLFIQEIYSKATGEMVKFADDSNSWHSEMDINAIAKALAD
jgi:hypothetical protein